MNQRWQHQEKLEFLLLEGLESGKANPLAKKDMEKVRRAVKARDAKRKP